MKKSAIILIDDDITVLESLEMEIASIIDSKKYILETCNSGNETIDICQNLMDEGIEIALIICDYLMPGIRGDSLLSILHNSYPNAIKIMLTGHIDVNSITNAINNAGLFRFIPKPWEKNDFDLAIIEALKHYEYKTKITEQNKLLEKQNSELSRLNINNAKKREQLALAIESSNMFFWELIVGEYFKIDDNIFEILGYERYKDVTNYYPVLDHIEREDREKILKFFACEENNDKNFQFDVRLKNINEKTLWFRIRGKQIQYKDDSKRFITGICFDVTEEIERNEILIDSELKYTHLYNNLALGVVRARLKTNNDDKITDVKFLDINDSAAGIFNIDASAVQGKYLSEFNSNGLPEKYNDFLTRVYKTGEQNFGEFYFEEVNRYIYVIASRFASNKDQIMFILFDLTKHYHYEEEIRKAKELAEESDKMKSAFLANISHEIRTPLNQIMGFSQLLAMNDIDNSERKEYSEILLRNSESLLQMITDVIDIARIEAKQLQLTKNATSLNYILHDLYEKYKKELTFNEKENINFYTTKPLPDEDVAIETDESRLAQVLSNLLDNAVKFTSEGFIELGYYTNSDQSLISIYIKDTGIGIKDEYLEKIFEQFWQADSSFTRKYEGTGIGLAVCRSMTKLLGGDIMVHSELGKGSTFTIVLPFVKPQF
jgi:signal transduction histidine kinase/FixJ family two-component response regulator